MGQQLLQTEHVAEGDGNRRAVLLAEMVAFAAPENNADAELKTSFKEKRVLVFQNKFHAQAGRNAIVEL